jgi:hypothetical protein
MNRAENIYHYMHGTKTGPGADPDYAERYHPGTGGKQSGKSGQKDSAIQDLKRRVDGYAAGGQSRPFRRRTGRNSGNNVATYELDPAVAKKLNAAGISTPLIEETTDIDRFTQAITEGKASTKFGAQVSILSPEDYANARLFLTPDGKAGFAILNGNELVSLFNHRDSPYRGVSASLVMLGVQEGGRRLENFDTCMTVDRAQNILAFRRVNMHGTKSGPHADPDYEQRYHPGSGGNKLPSKDLHLKHYEKDILILQNPTDERYRRFRQGIRREYEEMGWNVNANPLTRVAWDRYGNKFVWQADKGTHYGIEVLLSGKLGIEGLGTHRNLYERIDMHGTKTGPHADPDYTDKYHPGRGVQGDMFPLDRLDSNNLPDEPPEGWIRIYRGVNPERLGLRGKEGAVAIIPGKTDNMTDTIGRWFTTDYWEAVNYANWDYEGTGELGPDRAILAVDIPINDAIAFAGSGSRIGGYEDGIQPGEHFEMLVDSSTANRSIFYEGDKRIAAIDMGIAP